MAYRFDIVGVRINAGLPLGVVEYPYMPGTTALVGVNGAGKTRLLHAVGEALQGRLAPGVATADIVVRATASPEGRLDAVHVAVREALLGRQRPAIDAFDVAEAVRSLVRSRLLPEPSTLASIPEELREAFIAAGHRNRWLPLADEAAEQATFCLSLFPGGGQELWLAGARTGDAPTITTMFNEAFEAWENASQAVEEALCLGDEDTDHLIDTRPFFDGEVWVDETNYGDDNPFRIGALPQPLLRVAAMPRWPITARWEPDPTSVQRDTESLFATAFRHDDGIVEGDPADDEDDSDPPSGNSNRPRSGGYRFTAQVELWCSELSARASAAWGALVADATALVVRPRPLAAWIRGPAVEWRAFDLPTESWVPLAELSAAQQRWAAFSIASALAGPPLSAGVIGRWSDRNRAASILLLDEPERALHRTAETDLGRRLRAMASTGGPDIVIATHSPRVAAEANRLLLVKRGIAGVDLAPMDADILQSAAELGLEPTDLLGWYRAIVLVEGEHDRVILECLVGDDLRRLRCRVLQMEGGRNLPGVIESQMLFDFTGAVIIPVLDKTRADRLNDTWAEACARADSGSTEEAKAAIRAALNDKTSETSWMRQFLSRAIERGRSSRVSPYGLSADDILRYVNPHLLRADLPDWDALEERWHQQRPDGERDIKRWLDRTGVDLSAPHVAAAAAATRPMPEEILGLIGHIESTLDQQA